MKKKKEDRVVWLSAVPVREKQNGLKSQHSVFVSRVAPEERRERQRLRTQVMQAESLWRRWSGGAGASSK